MLEKSVQQIKTCKWLLKPGWMECSQRHCSVGLLNHGRFLWSLNHGRHLWSLLIGSTYVQSVRGHSHFSCLIQSVLKQIGQHILLEVLCVVALQVCNAYLEILITILNCFIKCILKYTLTWLGHLVFLA